MPETNYRTAFVNCTLTVSSRPQQLRLPAGPDGTISLKDVLSAGKVTEYDTIQINGNVVESVDEARVQNGDFVDVFSQITGN